MSGVNRLIMADLADSGTTGEEAMKALSPENIREEATKDQAADKDD